MSVDEKEPVGHTPSDLAGLLINEPEKPAKAGNKGPDDDSPADDADVADALIDSGDEGGEDWKSSDKDQSDPAKADDEADDGDGKEGADTEDSQDTEPRYTVKVDGKEVAVTLKEALAGWTRTQDYTAKTQELAEQRKATEQELGQARAAREQYAAVLTILQKRIGDDANEPSQAQWDKLAAQNPERYATEYANYQRRKEARQNIKAEQTRLEGEKAAEGQKFFTEQITKEREALFEKVPTWKDPERYKAGSKQVFDFARERYGFSDQELSRAYDHRIVVMAEDARRYHALMAKTKAAKTKLEAAPTVPPRARTPQVPKRQAERAEAEKRFNKTGRLEDALPLMLIR